MDKVLVALLKLEDFISEAFISEVFISEAFPFEVYLTGLWCNNVSLGAEVRKGWKELGPLLLLNTLWTRRCMIPRGS
jgi:hypothetical protein